MERRVFTEGVQYVLQPWTTIFCKARDDVIESLSGERHEKDDGGLCGGVGEGGRHRAPSGVCQRHPCACEDVDGRAASSPVPSP